MRFLRPNNNKYYLSSFVTLCAISCTWFTNEQLLQLMRGKANSLILILEAQYIPFSMKCLHPPSCAFFVTLQIAKIVVNILKGWNTDCCLILNMKLSSIFRWIQDGNDCQVLDFLPGIPQNKSLREFCIMTWTTLNPLKVKS